MKPTLIIIALLSYAFIELPIEITDNFLVYLIPFIISIVGLLICLINFKLIKKVENKFRLSIKIANIITAVIFFFLVLFNFPIPESMGLRCKNWTDISMLINPNDNSEQYVFQSLEISGSIYSHRQAKVEPINSWLRWHHKVKKMPQFGEWLLIDNSNEGLNAVPFSLDNTKIIYEKEKHNAETITLVKGERKKEEVYDGDFSSYKEIDTTQTIVIEKHIVDLNLDNIKDTVILENVKELIGDPQIFTILKIKISYDKDYIFHNVDGYKIDSNTKLKFPNKINSDKIYIPDFNKKENYIIVWGYQYPSCDAEVSVYKIEKEKVENVFKQAFYISEIDDFDKNGLIDFKGKENCEESEKELTLTIK